MMMSRVDNMISIYLLTKFALRIKRAGAQAIARTYGPL